VSPDGNLAPVSLITAIQASKEARQQRLQEVTQTRRVLLGGVYPEGMEPIDIVLGHSMVGRGEGRPFSNDLNKATAGTSSSFIREGDNGAGVNGATPTCGDGICSGELYFSVKYTSVNRRHSSGSFWLNCSQ
jgi:hypothetical protein